MANEKRDIFDDIYEGIRQVIEDLDRVIRPDKQKKHVPVPVPVPVRPDRYDPRNYPNS